MHFPRSLFCQLGVAIGFVAVTAHAGPSDPSSLDLQRLLSEAVTALQGLGPSLLPSSRPSAPAESATTPRWFGSSPRLSLVARDWGQSHLLAGSELSLVDQLRRSRSLRMLVSRVRLDQGAFIPFVQVGFGQWRVDPELLPAIPRDTEYAAQLACGFEARIGRFATVGLEADETLLVRESREPQNIPDPRVYGLFGAVRAEF